MRISDERLRKVAQDCGIKDMGVAALAADLKDARAENARLREACRAALETIDHVFFHDMAGLAASPPIVALRAALAPQGER